MRILDTLTANSGISLIEVLMIIMMMSVIVLPEMMLMSQTMNTTQGSSTLANRSNLSNILASEVNPNRQLVGNSTYLNMASQSTAYKEPNSSFSGSRNTIPFMTVQDSTNSNAFTKVFQVYEYNNGVASTSPRIASMAYDSTDEIRIDLGSFTSTVDSSLRPWGSATGAYSASLKSYGGVSHTPVNNVNNGTPLNLTDSADQSIYATQDAETYPLYLAYDIDVPNGPYSVKLLFNENCTNCNRAMLITIEGQQMNSDAYEPYTLAGAINRAHILQYDTYVSDGKLSISLRGDASTSSQVAQCAGIIVNRRDLP